MQLRSEPLRGSPLAERVLARAAELELTLLDLDESGSLQRTAIEAAIAAAETFVTGDIEQPSDVVAHALAAWLERTKNLGLVAIDHGVRAA